MKVLLSVLLTILACDQAANGLRILGLFPLHGKSHWIMQEALMKELAKRGHQVDVVTHFPLKKPIPNYKDISLEGSLPSVVNNMSAVEVLRFQTPNVAYLVQMAGTQLCELLNHPKLQELIKNPPQDPPYDLIVTESFAAPCFLAFGRHLKVPIIATVASVFHDWLNEVSGNPANPAFVPSFFSTHSSSMNFKERLTNAFLSNYLSWQFHYHSNKQVAIVKEHFGLDLSCIKDLYNDIAVYLVNSHHSLNGIRPMTTSVIEIGGMHLKDDNPPSPEVQKWLDESKDGCIYFTFGSMVRIETFPKETVQQFYAAFEKIAPVRVLMKVAKKEDLLPGLPKNVMTQSWFPQISVLKHKNIRAFITHGGVFSTQEAIYTAVPMIGVPLFGDQAINIQNYVNKKVAVSLDIRNITEAKVTSALNTILKDPSYSENIRKLSNKFLDRPLSAMDTSVYWIEYIGKYGNVLRSPALDLYWWQRELLDVYAFIFGIMAVGLYVVLFILCKIKKCLCGSRTCAKKDSAAMKSKKNK
ncbi:UDP-glucosyltransferase 2 [Solenopsis invicta]|uniref:UDP-glucosyltransferase 2 n=1 Tax=Solenopsis invicta TaxID=13686 RepID=UPI0001FE7962|nr:UDP-glucosyltransferase 2 [Solenopsis invicta]